MTRSKTIHKPRKTKQQVQVDEKTEIDMKHKALKADFVRRELVRFPQGWMLPK